MCDLCLFRSDGIPRCNMASITRLYMSRTSKIGRKAMKCKNPDNQRIQGGEGKPELYRSYLPPYGASPCVQHISEERATQYDVFWELDVSGMQQLSVLAQDLPPPPVAPLSEQHLLIRYAGRKTVWRRDTGCEIRDQRDRSRVQPRDPGPTD